MIQGNEKHSLHYIIDFRSSGLTQLYQATHTLKKYQLDIKPSKFRRNSKTFLNLDFC